MRHRHGREGTRPVNRNGRAIGLDLGATAIRAGILTVGSKGGFATVTVHGIGSVPLPPGAVVNGAVVERDVVVAALKKLRTIKGFHGTRIILGVANPQVVVRPLQIPNLTVAQRAKALPFQAREIIALPLDEVILDYAQVGEADPETGMVSGLLIATPRRPVLTAVEAIAAAGLKVARVDLSSFGALRAVANQHLIAQAVIDVGAQLTSIVIHHHGVPQLVRTLTRGGQELTELLMENLDLSREEAEIAKCETGLVGGDATSAALRAGIRPLLAEIRSSINYFRAGADNALLQEISLTGGGSALAGLAEVLSDQLGIPAGVVDPMERIADRAAGMDPGATSSGQVASAVSIGLAMGAAA